MMEWLDMITCPEKKGVVAPLYQIILGVLDEESTWLWGWDKQVCGLRTPSVLVLSLPVHADCSLIKWHSLDVLSFSLSCNFFQEHTCTCSGWVTFILQCCNKRLWMTRSRIPCFDHSIEPVLQLTLTVCTLWIQLCWETNWLCRQRPVLSPVTSVHTPAVRQRQQKDLWTGKCFWRRVEGSPPKLIWPLLWMKAGNTSWLGWSHGCATRPLQLLAKVPQQQPQWAYSQPGRKTLLMTKYSTLTLLFT